MSTPLTSVFKGRREIAVATATTSPHTLTNLSPEGLNVDTTSGAITVNLPLISTVPGQSFIIRKVDASLNAVTIQGSGGELIEGAANTTLTSHYQALTITNDGSQWLKSATNATGSSSIPSVSGGEVLFANGSAQPAGETLLKWDSVNKRLGVNNATPLTTLHVTGAGTFSGAITASNLSGTNTGDTRQEIHITLLAAGTAITF